MKPTSKIFSFESQLQKQGGDVPCSKSSESWILGTEMYVTSPVETSQGSGTKESESQGYLTRRCHNYQVLNVARIESGDTCSGDKEFRVRVWYVTTWTHSTVIRNILSLEFSWSTKVVFIQSRGINHCTEGPHSKNFTTYYSNSQHSLIKFYRYKWGCWSEINFLFPYQFLCQRSNAIWIFHQREIFKTSSIGGPFKEIEVAKKFSIVYNPDPEKLYSGSRSGPGSQKSRNFPGSGSRMIPASERCADFWWCHFWWLTGETHLSKSFRHNVDNNSAVPKILGQKRKKYLVCNFRIFGSGENHEFPQNGVTVQKYGCFTLLKIFVLTFLRHLDIPIVYIT